MSYSGWPYGAPHTGSPSPYSQYGNMYQQQQQPQQQPPYSTYQQQAYGAPAPSAMYGAQPAYSASPSQPPLMYAAPLAPRSQSHFNYGPPPPARSMAASAPLQAPYASAPAYAQQSMSSVQQQQQLSTSSNDLNDPNIFRAFYRSGLQQLTFNSRTIIEKLTALAADYSLRMATVVSDEIQNHIRSVPPHMKLPALYLTDMIVKNISHPYTALFARFIDRLFLQAYRDVDLPVKQKMEELLGSWRTGGPNGSEVYPERTLKIIEDGLYGVRGRGGGIGASGRGKADAEHYNAGVQQRPSMASTSEVAALTQEIQSVLGAVQARRHRAPHDEENLKSLAILQRLEVTVVPGIQLTAEQLSAFRQELVKLASQAQAGSQPSAEPNAQVTSAATSSLGALLSAQGNASSLSAALSNLDPSLVASLGAIAGPPVPVQQKEAAELAYEDKLFRGFAHDPEQVGLTVANINRPLPDAHQLLYEDLTLECTQCAARWLETERHHKVLQKHMDRHFRINNRLSGALRAQSRNWLVLEEDWLSAPLPEVENPEKMEEAEIAAEVARSFVKVPNDPLKASKPCPICKEKFKQQWNEASEDFVWKDAKQVDGVIYHASCYLETRRARNNSKKAKTEGSMISSLPPSREGTPQVSGSPTKAKILADAHANSPSVKVEEPESPDVNRAPVPEPASSTQPDVSPSEGVPDPAVNTSTSAPVDNLPSQVKQEEVDEPVNGPEVHSAPQTASAPQQHLEATGASVPPQSESNPNAATAPLAIDSNLLAALAGIVSRSNTPATGAPAAAAEPGQAHSRKRSVEAMEDQTEPASQDTAGSPDASAPADHGAPEAKRSKQEEAQDHSEEEEALYSVSAHR